MKKLIFYSVFLFSYSIGSIFTCLYAQQPARLIIRADDMGAFHSVNNAIMDTYRNGITTSVEVMPVTPWFPEAVRMLNENPRLDVGVHLTITSEWENVKWRPLTYCPGLVDHDGYFFPMMAPMRLIPDNP